MNYYSNPLEVIHMMNLNFEDFGFDTQEQFITFIENKLIEIKDFIDNYCSKDFSVGIIPPAIHGIARDMCQNTLMSGLISRQSSVSSIGESPDFYNIKVVTDDIKIRLNVYKEKTKQTFTFKRVGSNVTV